MNGLEHRDDPQNAEQADAETDDDHRAYRIARAAQDGGEDLDQCPGEVEGNDIQQHLPGGLHDGRVFCQQMQQRPCHQHNQGAEPDAVQKAEDEPLLHAEPDAVCFPCPEILPDKAGDSGTQRIAHRPEDSVDF